MEAEEIMVVAGSVVALTQLVKWMGVPDRLGPLVVLGVALIGVGVWAYSIGVFERTQAFSYFAGWIVVATSAAGVYGYTRSAASALTQMRPPPDSGAGSERTTD